MRPAEKRSRGARAVAQGTPLSDSRLLAQVYDLELPMMGVPRDFIDAFYSDDAAWAALQHRERGDKSALRPRAQPICSSTYPQPAAS